MDILSALFIIVNNKNFKTFFILLSLIKKQKNNN